MSRPMPKEREKARADYAAAKKTPLGSGARFKAVEESAAASGASDPGAVAAAIGRKKYGAKKFAAMGKAGH